MAAPPMTIGSAMTARSAAVRSRDMTTWSEENRSPLEYGRARR
jgi:hypothetical protein